MVSFYFWNRLGAVETRVAQETATLSEQVEHASGAPTLCIIAVDVGLVPEWPGAGWRAQMSRLTQELGAVKASVETHRDAVEAFMFLIYLNPGSLSTSLCRLLTLN